MKNKMLYLTNTFTKMIFFTKCQIEDLVQMDKYPSKWPWFSQINHPNFTLNQNTHLMT
jgi:hypothetical protein